MGADTNMKVELTTIIKQSGNSHCIFIPKMQMDLLGVRKGDAVHVTIERAEDPKE